MEERKRSKTVAQKQNKGHNNIKLDKVVGQSFITKLRKFSTAELVRKRSRGISV